MTLYALFRKYCLFLSLLFTVLLSSHPANANSRCQDLLTREMTASPHPLGMSFGHTADSILIGNEIPRLVWDWARAANSILREIKAPYPTVHIAFGDVLNGAYSPATNSITTFATNPATLRTDTAITNYIEIYRAVFLHEYMHGAFAHTLAQYSPLYRELHEANIEAYHKPFSTSSREKERTREIRKLVSPYDELFADVGAILSGADPAIMATFGDGRDFRQALAPEDWTNTEAHSLFGPVRSMLWKHVLKGLSTEEQKARVAMVVIEVMKDEIETLITKARLVPLDSALEPVSPKELNQKLIESFRILWP